MTVAQCDATTSGPTAKRQQRCDCEDINFLFTNVDDDVVLHGPRDSDEDKEDELHEQMTTARIILTDLDTREIEHQLNRTEDEVNEEHVNLRLVEGNYRQLCIQTRSRTIRS